MDNAVMTGPRFTVSAGATLSDSPTVTAVGDIDLASVEKFRRLLDQAAHSAAALTVDLRGVTYCDSSAMRALFSVAAITEVTLLAPSAAPITTLLRISGLDRITTVSTSE